jgi:hypothetical protein
MLKRVWMGTMRGTMMGTMMDRMASWRKVALRSDPELKHQQYQQYQH